MSDNQQKQTPLQTQSIPPDIKKTQIAGQKLMDAVRDQRIDAMDRLANAGAYIRHLEETAKILNQRLAAALLKAGVEIDAGEKSEP